MQTEYAMNFTISKHIFCPLNEVNYVESLHEGNFSNKLSY